MQGIAFLLDSPITVFVIKNIITLQSYQKTIILVVERYYYKGVYGEPISTRHIL